MTPLRPPSAMPPWSADPSRVADFGSEMLALSATLDDCGRFADGGARCPGWTGAAGAAYAARAARLGRRADALSATCREIANAVLAHATALTRLHARHAALCRRHDDLDRLVRATRLALPAAGSVAEMLLGALAAPAGPGALEGLLAAYEADRRAWVVDLDAACGQVRRALDRAPVGEAGSSADSADAALATMPTSGADPAEVATWWRRLSPAQRSALVVAAPAVIGNRDGLPARARSRANTVALDCDLAVLGAIPAALRTRAEAARYANARAAAAARTSIEEQARDARTGEPLVPQIYAYDPDAFDGDGAVAMAAGDLDTAADVVVTVPGFGTDAQSAAYQGERAIMLHRAMDHEDPHGGHAAMFWIGYDAPDNTPWDGHGLDAAGVVGEQMAVAGGDRLADLVDGLDAMRARPAHLTAIGHSYGSTTLGHALHDHRTGVDDVAFVGSPGVGGDVRTAADLEVPAGHVWVGADSRDPITRLGDTGEVGLGTLAGGGLGRNPAEDGFGAVRFRAETSNHRGGPLAEHSTYFDPGSESLANLARIATGHDDAVTIAGGVHDPAPDLGDVGDAVAREYDAEGRLLHGLTHPWELGGDIAAAGTDLLRGVTDLGGPVIDPEATRTPPSAQARR